MGRVKVLGGQPVKTKPDPAAAVRKIKLLIHWTGQEAAKYYNCSQEVATALEDVENGRLHDAIDGMKAIRARLVQLQQQGQL